VTRAEVAEVSGAGEVEGLEESVRGFVKGVCYEWTGYRLQRGMF